MEIVGAMSDIGEMAQVLSGAGEAFEILGCIFLLLYMHHISAP